MRVILLACLLLLLTACQARPDAVAAHAGTDFATLDRATYLKAAGRLGPALGRPVPAADDLRGGPLWIRAVSAGYQSCWREAGTGERAVVQQVGPDGAVAWTAVVGLGEGGRVTSVVVENRAGLGEVLVLRAEVAASAAAVLYLTTDATGAGLLRAETVEGALANRRVHTDHPALPLRTGDLGGSPVAALAATVHLVTPDHAAERAKPAVRSHLTQLAAGNDPWLAQAAAELLTLP